MSAGKTFTKTEVQAGLFVIVALVATAAIAIAALNIGPAQKRSSYWVYFTDTVGLNIGAEVRFGGLKVGRVATIEHDPDDPSRIRVEARIEDSTPVNEASEAYISQVTLTAPKHLAISTGDKEAARLQAGATIPPGGGDLFSIVADAATGVQEILTDVKKLLGTQDEDGNQLARTEFGNVGQTLLTLNDFFADLRLLVGTRDAETGETIEPANFGDAATLAAFIGDLRGVAQKGEDIADTVEQLLTDDESKLNNLLTKAGEAADNASTLMGEVTTVVQDNKETIGETVTNARDLLAKLNETIDKLEPKLESIVDDISVATGEVADLMVDNGPTIEEIIYDVREMIRDLRVFAETIANEPNAFITGRGVSGRQ